MKQLRGTSTSCLTVLWIMKSWSIYDILGRNIALCFSFIASIQVGASSQGARALPTSLKSRTNNGVLTVFCTIFLFTLSLFCTIIPNGLWKFNFLWWWWFAGVCFIYPALCVADEHSKKGLIKFSVKFFLHSSGNIAAKFQYDQVLLTKSLAEYWFYYSILNPSQTRLCLCLTIYMCKCRALAHTLEFVLHQVVVATFRKIPNSSWNAKERYVSPPFIQFVCLCAAHQCEHVLVFWIGYFVALAI